MPFRSPIRPFLGDAESRLTPGSHPSLPHPFDSASSRQFYSGSFRSIPPAPFRIRLVNPTRSTLLAVAALAFLRIVVGLHFFLEGTSHLRDPDWSSAGFRKAAVGPWAGRFRAALPQEGDWSGTLGSDDGRPVAEAAAAWRASVVDSWRKLLDSRGKLVPLDPGRREAAEKQLAAAAAELEAYVDGLSEDLADHRLQLGRLAAMERSPVAGGVPFARDRVAKKRRELAAQADGWMKDAAAIGGRLVAAWNGPLSAGERLRVEAAVQPSGLWKADRFVSWSLATIGACLVLGLFTKFNAIGGACFLASVIATQPFWVAGAQPTYDQWVELAALLAIAALPTGGWSGLDYFLSRFSPCCRSRHECEVGR
ncbi:MAG: hypothetical protein EBZ59_10135 [Planctomycetia bacterium]|nr:hypothetical protein [Planctomycetia bacterium]